MISYYYSKIYNKKPSFPLFWRGNEGEALYGI